MIDVIKQYYKAIITQDIDLLQQVIYKKIFGVRTYKEVKLFTNEELIQYVKTNRSTSFTINHVEDEEDTYHLDMNFEKHHIYSKVVLKDHKVYKVYEVLATNKRRIKCSISYDGSPYSGYQKQQNAPSIQGDIEQALQKIFHEELIIHSSGRTDKGVHAIHQVIHFDVDTKIKIEHMKKLFNSYLPDAIYVKQVEEVPLTFHSRYDVKVKTYQYVIHVGDYNPIRRNYEWTVDSLDVDKLKKDIHEIVGEHDFASFTKSTDQSTVRTIYKATVESKDNHVYITIEGNGFLRYMVRNIVGALVTKNNKKLPYTIKDLILLKDVNILKDIAPARGLYLYNVQY